MVIMEDKTTELEARILAWEMARASLEKAAAADKNTDHHHVVIVSSAHVLTIYPFPQLALVQGDQIAAVVSPY